MPERFTPLNDNVLVLPAGQEKVRPSGLVLSDEAAEPPTKGTVVAAGPGALQKRGSRLPVPVGPGDTVVFGKDAGHEVVVGGVRHLLFRAEGILGIVRA